MQSEEHNIQLIKNLFSELFEKRDIQEFDTYFSHDFEIDSNTARMDYKTFKERLSKVFPTLQSIQYQYPLLDIFASKNKVAARFSVTIIDHNQRKTETHSIAIYQIKDNKIFRWWEITYPDWQTIQ